MRIVHVIDGLDPDTGGPAAVVLRLAAAQAGRGHDVAIVTKCGRQPFVEYKSNIACVPNLEKVEILEVTRGTSRTREVISRSIGPDAGRAVMHLHGVWCKILLDATRVARKRGICYAVMLHGSLDPWSIAQKRWKKFLALRLGRRRLLEGAGFLHVLNQDEVDLLEPLRIVAPKVIIPNGVFAEEVGARSEPGRFYNRYPKLGCQRYILFLGRLHYKKGLDYLAEMFALVASKVPDVRLVVAGPDGGARREFEERVATRGLALRVLITGPLYGHAKLEALSDAACFCLPSRQEGFSMAITEALAIGCPVVISENCHFPEVAESGSGFVVRLDAAELAGAVLQILTDESLRKQMGCAGQDLVSSSYTWERIAEAADRAYRVMCPKARRGWIKRPMVP